MTTAVKDNKGIDSNPWVDLNVNEADLQQLLDKPLALSIKDKPATSLCTDEANKGFDASLGDTWIYPSNLPCRTYQLSIIEKSMYRNTLVVLPTGLGKTFIAAVVMYNIYRWYPKGKVIFMAPTRPLVSQQIEACQNIMPFPNQDTVEITGRLPKAKRSELWQTKRVFFVTPQVVQSDICPSASIDDYNNINNNNINKQTEFPFEHIKLLVVDEAHRAKGRYAYTEVVQAIAQKIKYFRVLALTATPGRTMDDVAEVCRNLLISHIEVRCDNSIDVQPYIHRRRMETVVVELSEQIKSLREQMLRIIDPYLRQLSDEGILSGSLSTWNRNSLLFEHKHFRDYCERNGRHKNYGQINTNFSICISLYHALELLERHGVQAFLHNFEEDIDGKDKFILKMDSELRNMIDNLKYEMADRNPFNISAAVMTNGQVADMPRNLDFGHPKFEKARDCLVKHFQANEDSRAIVFCEYRESVMLIHRMLLQQKPLLRPRCFVGQGNSTGHLRPLTQKQQLQIMQDFRVGKTNILIATSIGEEGIDVGEVDLIVCFDISTSNPTRFIQRIGRTGRKKNGNVVMLVTAGREQQLLKDVMANKDNINKKIHNAPLVQQSLYKESPRLVPTIFQPKCVHTCVTITNDQPATNAKNTTKKSTSKTRKSPVKGMQDMRKFLKRKSEIVMDAEDAKYFEIDQPIQQRQPNTQTRKLMEQSFQQMQNLFNDLKNPLETQETTITNAIETKTDQPLEVKDNTKEIRDVKYIRKLNKFFKTDFCSVDILKRSQIKDIVYHLKSRQMSKEMKLVLLQMQPDFIKTNLKQMEILKVLDQNEELAKDSTTDEILIREINATIMDLFGSLSAVESFLNEIETKSLKNNFCEGSEDEMSAIEALAFRKQLDEIFKDCDDYGPLYDNFDIIKSELSKLADYEKFIQMQQDNLDRREPSFGSTVKLELSNDGDNDIWLMQNLGEATSANQSKYSNNELSFCQNYSNNNIDISSTPIQQFQNKINKDLSIKQDRLVVDEITENSPTIENAKNEENMKITITKPANEELTQIPTTTTTTTGPFTKTSIPDALKSASIIINTPASTETSAENIVKNSNDTCDFQQVELAEWFDKSNLFNLTEEEIPTTSSRTDANVSADSELEIDIDMFLQPMPEETILLSNTHSPKLLGSTKTQGKRNLPILQSPPSKHNTHSPDLFSETLNFSNSLMLKENINEVKDLATKSTVTNNLSSNSPMSLAAKLSVKAKQNNNHYKNETKTVLTPCNGRIFNSPTNRPSINKEKFERSPNLFEMYMQNTGGKGKLPAIDFLKSANKASCRPLQQAVIDSPLSASSSLGSPIKRTESIGKLVKRKIIDSDTDDEDTPKIMDNGNKDETDFEESSEKTTRTELSDFLTELNDTELNAALEAIETEEIPATQPISRNLRCRRNKRRNLNSFIQREAVLCGPNDDDDDDDDDFEDTLDDYKYDSIVINSDDNEEVVTTSATQIQAMYLQSVKSPQCRPNAFKIPAKRQFNDASTIFSQEVLSADVGASQYINDSFIVDDAAEEERHENTSLCPLERAEKILKARRRAKRRLNNAESSEPLKRKRIQQIIELDSSSEEEFIL